MSQTKNNIYKQIEDVLLSSKKVLIASHRDPDGDSIGSQLAMAGYVESLGKKANIISHGDIPYKYEFLPGINGIQKYSDESPADFNTAIILDCSEIDRIGDVKKLLSDNTTILNVDHHPDNRKFGCINLHDSKASCVGEILMELFLDRGWDFGNETATHLYTAIMTDTGRFRFDSTTRRTMELTGILLEKGVSAREITDRVYFSIPPDILKMTGVLLSKMSFYDNDRICIIGMDSDMVEKYNSSIGDLEGLAEYTLYGRNTMAGGLLKEQPDNRTKVSLRSRHKRVDVSRLAQKYGGGGHVNASGCIVELPFEKARDKIVEDLKELVNGSV